MREERGGGRAPFHTCKVAGNHGWGRGRGVVSVLSHQFLDDICRVLLSLPAHTLLVLGSEIAEDLVRLCLRGILDVGIAEKILNADQQLSDGYRGLPVLVFIQKRKAHLSGGVHIRVEEGRLEFALGRRRGEIILEHHLDSVESSLPDGVLLAGDGAIPHEEIERSISILRRFRDESEGVVLSPGSSLLCQSSGRDSRHL
ncbi:hypothetical protein PENTCL1PPCAC_18655, partial [Pristionchus entomophagus]